MTSFDESKHNRSGDGKFTHKPHSEADDVVLSRVQYVPPSRALHGPGGERGWEGDRYEQTRQLGAAPLAKLMRSDIKEGVEHGWLPEGPKYTVTTRNQVVDITVSDLPEDREVYDYTVAGDKNTGFYLDRELKPEYAQMRDRLQGVHDSYNKVTRDQNGAPHRHRRGDIVINDDHADAVDQHLAADRRVDYMVKRVEDRNAPQSALGFAQRKAEAAQEHSVIVASRAKALRMVAAETGELDWEAVARRADQYTQETLDRLR